MIVILEPRVKILSTKKEINMKKNYLLLALAMLVLPLSASADEAVLGKLCELYDCIFSNGLVLAIATIAILFLGIGAFFGKTNWGLVFVTGVGMVTIAGAAQIALLLLGDDAVGDADNCGDGECEPIVLDTI